MDDALVSLLRRLEQFNIDTDARVTDRSRRMLNITPDTGPFLVLLIRAMKARRVLEIGTSNGTPRYGSLTPCNLLVEP